MNGKRQKSQAGFALPLILMMMGVTLLLMVAVFNLNVIATKVVERAYLQSQFRTLITQINSMLKEEGSCRAAIGGRPEPDATPASGKLPYPLAGQRYTGTADQPIYLYYPQIQTHPFITSSGGPMPLNAPTPSATPSTYGDLRITQFALAQASPLPVTAGANFTIYETTLNIAAEPVRYSEATWQDGGQSFSGGKTFTSDEIQITLVVDNATGFIRSCNSLSFGASNNPVPIPVCTPLYFLSATHGQAVCRRLGCPPPGLRYGWNADGSPSCSPTTTSTPEPTPLP